MKSWKFLKVFLCVSVLALAGCTGKTGLTWFQDTQRVTGPDPLIDPDSFEKIDLAVLLDPSDEMKGFTEKSKGDQRRILEKAFKEFYGRGSNMVLDRNRIQERIIAASNQRCGQYKNFIKQFDAAVNLTLGGLTTATAGAGAIFTAASTVRALSGIASIFSGLRAEVNDAYFQNLTIQVITNGFESKRREIYEEIVNKRSVSTSLVDYPVEKAIGDAILYHQHCSLIAGLEQAALSIQRAENPGMKQMRKFRKDERGEEAAKKSDELKLISIEAGTDVANANGAVAAAESRVSSAQAKMDAAQKGTSEEKLADEELKSAKKVLVAAKARLKFSKARLSELQKTSEIADKYSKSFQTPISPATLSDAGDKQGANDTSLQPSPPAVPSNPIKGVKSLPPPMKLEVPAR